jgi:hypothetical protein
MKKVIDNMPHQIIAIFACMMVILGLFWARAIFATGIIILLGNALINKNILQIWQQLFKHKVLLSIFFLFIVYVFSGFWSSNTAYFLSKLQLHLPFLAIPLGVLSFPNLDTKHVKWIFYASLIIKRYFYFKLSIYQLKDVIINESLLNSYCCCR